MTTPRGYGHSRPLCSLDGKVLIAGGGPSIQSDGSLAYPTLASAELYDPNTGTFSATGNLTTKPRVLSHAATLLNEWPTRS